MPILSAKRQITLPKELCDRLNIQPGDDLSIVEHGGKVTNIKKQKNASAGILKTLKADNRFTDDDSLLDTVAKRRAPTKRKRNAA